MTNQVEIYRKEGAVVYKIEKWGFDIGSFARMKWNPQQGLFTTESGARKELEDVAKSNPADTYRIVKAMPDLPPSDAGKHTFFNGECTKCGVEHRRSYRPCE